MYWVNIELGRALTDFFICLVHLILHIKPYHSLCWGGWLIQSCCSRFQQQQPIYMFGQNIRNKYKSIFFGSIRVEFKRGRSFIFNNFSVTFCAALILPRNSSHESTNLCPPVHLSTCIAKVSTSMLHIRQVIIRVHNDRHFYFSSHFQKKVIFNI